MFYLFFKRVEKRDKMRGLPSILSLLRNELNNINNTGARMLDYLSYDIKITFKSYFCRKILYFSHYFPNVVKDVITFPENL